MVAAKGILIERIDIMGQHANQTWPPGSGAEHQENLRHGRDNSPDEAVKLFRQSHQQEEFNYENNPLHRGVRPF
jgi:hypothetical protein